MAKFTKEFMVYITLGFLILINISVVVGIPYAIYTNDTNTTGYHPGQLAWLTMCFIAWVGTYYMLSETSVCEARNKIIYSCRSFRGILQLVSLFAISVLLGLQVMYIALRYRKTRSLSLGLDDDHYTIKLRKSEYDVPEGCNGISEEDLNEHFITVNDELLFKSEQSAIYILIAYTPANILRSFGFIGGFDDSQVQSVFSKYICPIKRAISAHNSIPLEKVTDDVIAQTVKVS